MRLRRLLATLGTILAVMIMAGCSAQTVAAPTVQLKSGNTGTDVSYPQCGRQLPDPGALAIVGINGEKANLPNPCLHEQLEWVRASGKPLMHYVNPSNPVGENVDSWPTQGVTPYGICDGSQKPACSYQYGVDRITQDVTQFLGVDSLADGTMVFIAVEHSFSWANQGPRAIADEAAAHASNLAAIEGMVSAIQRFGGQPGIYSTGADWRELMGKDAVSGNRLYGVPVWMRGAASKAALPDTCRQPSFTGGRVVMAQVPGENRTKANEPDLADPSPLDFDLVC